MVFAKSPTSHSQENGLARRMPDTHAHVVYHEGASPFNASLPRHRAAVPPDNKAVISSFKVLL